MEPSVNFVLSQGQLATLLCHGEERQAERSVGEGAMVVRFVHERLTGVPA